MHNHNQHNLHFTPTKIQELALSAKNNLLFSFSIWRVLITFTTCVRELFFNFKNISITFFGKLEVFSSWIGVKFVIMKYDVRSYFRNKSSLVATRDIFLFYRSRNFLTPLFRASVASSDSCPNGRMDSFAISALWMKTLCTVSGIQLLFLKGQWWLFREDIENNSDDFWMLGTCFILFQTKRHKGGHEKEFMRHRLSIPQMVILYMS